MVCESHTSSRNLSAVFLIEAKGLEGVSLERLQTEPAQAPRETQPVAQTAPQITGSAAKKKASLLDKTLWLSYEFGHSRQANVYFAVGGNFISTFKFDQRVLPSISVC